MDVVVTWAPRVAWMILGGTATVCGLLAGRSDRARRTGIVAVSLLWVVAGALVNLLNLLDGDTYTGFASGSPIPFVRDTWESLVVPDHHLFIGLLIVGEAAAGLLVLVPGRVRENTLLALVAFNATLVVFGWGFAGWAIPLVTGLLLLRRAERHRGDTPPTGLRNPRRRPSAGASSGRHRSPRSRVPSP